MNNDIRQKVARILPLVVIVILVLVNIAAGAVLLLPKWQDHTSLVSTRDEQQAALNTLRGGDGSASDSTQIQIDNMQTRLNESAGGLLTSVEADSILNRIYSYASSSEAEITNLQLQSQEQVSEVYDVRQFKLQVEGTFAQLVIFLALFREASVPAISLNNLAVTAGPSGDVLTMDMLIYTSTHAQNEVLAALPQATLLAPMQTPLPTATTLPPTPTVTPAVTINPPTSTPVTPMVNAMVLGPGTYDDTNGALTYSGGTWETIQSQRGYGGDYHYTTDTTAQVEFSFIGTAVGIQYVAFKNFGTFEIYVDGNLWGEVDGYASEGTFGQIFYISGLEASAHTMTLRNTDRHNASSEGTVFAIDAIHIASTP
jgi:Tfp pilus assembly protein PilO